MSRFRAFAPGVKVRFSGKFLRSTGQLTGAEGRKSFIVLAVYPNGWLLVDEPAADPFHWYSDEERMADPRLLWRRVASENVTIVGQLDSRDCP